MNLIIKNRLYDLSINVINNYSFFYFYIFSLHHNYYSLLKKENIKITYLCDDNPNIIINQNRVYVIYNNSKNEVFNLSSMLNSLMEISVNTEYNFNICMSWNSILYTHYYYEYNIRYIYIKWITFLKKNDHLLFNFIIKCRMINIKMTNNIIYNIIPLNKYFLKKLFLNRFKF